MSTRYALGGARVTARLDARAVYRVIPTDRTSLAIYRNVVLKLLLCGVAGTYLWFMLGGEL